MKKHDPAIFHKLYGAHKPRVTYYGKDLLDYALMILLTALVVVQVSVRASLRTAIERSIAVVLGVLLALAIGDAIDLNGLSVGLLLAGSLGVAQLVLRLPASAARQVPVSILIVLTTVTSSQASYGWQRALETVVGAAIGVAVSLILPASRLVDASHTLHRLAVGLGGVLDANS